MTEQVAVKVGRRGWIWGEVLKVDLGGVAIHRRSVGKRKVKEDKVFKLECLGGTF